MLIRFQRPGSLHQLEKIGYPEQRSTCSDDDERIEDSNVRPTCGNGCQSTFTVVKPNPVFTPVLPAGDQFEHSLKQRMIRVGDSKTSVLSVAMRRI
jgi:hypothetical protein